VKRQTRAALLAATVALGLVLGGCGGGKEGAGDAPSTGAPPPSAQAAPSSDEAPPPSTQAAVGELTVWVDETRQQAVTAAGANFEAETGVKFRWC
jgi:arabinogalactan oligomer/maltooligosaccharide transport system substrate-binding protein